MIFLCKIYTLEVKFVKSFHEFRECELNFHLLNVCLKSSNKHCHISNTSITCFVFG